MQYNESALALHLAAPRGGGHLLLRPRCDDDGELLVFEDDSTAAAPIDGRPRAAVSPAHRASRTSDDAIYSIAERHARALRASSSSATTTSSGRSSTSRRPRRRATNDADLEVYDYPGGYVEPRGGQAARPGAARGGAGRAEHVDDRGRLHAPRRSAGSSRSPTLHDELDGDYVVIAALVHELGARRAAARPRTRSRPRSSPRP